MLYIVFILFMLLITVSDLIPHQPRQRRLARRAWLCSARRSSSDQRPLLEPHGAEEQEERPSAAGIEGVRGDRGRDHRDFRQAAVDRASATVAPAAAAAAAPKLPAELRFSFGAVDERASPLTRYTPRARPLAHARARRTQPWSSDPSRSTPPARAAPPPRPAPFPKEDRAEPARGRQA